MTLAARSLSEPRKKRTSWRVKSALLVVLGAVFALLMLATFGADLLMKHGDGVWKSTGIWIFIGICFLFVACVCIDLGTERTSS